MKDQYSCGTAGKIESQFQIILMIGHFRAMEELGSHSDMSRFEFPSLASEVCLLPSHMEHQRPRMESEKRASQAFTSLFLCRNSCYKMFPQCHGHGEPFEIYPSKAWPLNTPGQVQEVLELRGQWPSSERQGCLQRGVSRVHPSQVSWTWEWGVGHP